MRGKREARRTVVESIGLIPTYAGKTDNCLCPRPACRAHPHVCGENVNTYIPRVQFAGSSPRMRGKQRGIPGGLDVCGLIPTYAGKTRPAGSSGSSLWAHPHVCGENVGTYIPRVQFAGSSPRMRGKHLLTWGFIPTHQVLELVWSPKPVLTLHDFWAYRRREARLYLLALLHPFRGPSSSFGADGRIISFTPSKSTGSHG